MLFGTPEARGLAFMIFVRIAGRSMLKLRHRQFRRGMRSMKRSEPLTGTQSRRDQSPDSTLGSPSPKSAAGAPVGSSALWMYPANYPVGRPWSDA